METLKLKSLLDEKLNTLQYDILKNKELLIEDNSNIEYLHDLRVAVRKVRAIFVILEEYFLSDRLMICKKKFNKIGKITNAPRDLDVYLETLENFSLSMPNGDKNKLDRLLSILKLQRDEEYKVLISFIRSSKFIKTLDKFSLFTKGECYSALSEQDAKIVAKNRLSSLYEKISSDCHKLTITSSNKDFHKLRIEFKKLRYLIELFLPVYRKKKSLLLVSKLKSLQTQLGNFNDLDVQLNTLDSFITKYDLDIKEQEIIKILQLKFLKEQQEIKGKLLESFAPVMDDNFKDLLLSFK